MLYAPITLAIGIALALWVHFGSDRSVIRARHIYQRDLAAKVLSLASSLEDKLLWVALPFPALQLDAESLPQAWEDRPQHWERVRAREGSVLILDDEAGAGVGSEVRVKALGCDWYVYADASGWALDYSIANSTDAEANGDDQTDLPPGIDPESVRMPAIEIGK